jgi:hypothetical protein
VIECPSHIKLKSGDALYADADWFVVHFVLPGAKNSIATAVQHLLCFGDAQSYQSARYVLDAKYAHLFPNFLGVKLHLNW